MTKEMRIISNQMSLIRERLQENVKKLKDENNGVDNVEERKQILCQCKYNLELFETLSNEMFQLAKKSTNTEECYKFEAEVEDDTNLIIDAHDIIIELTIKLLSLSPTLPLSPTLANETTTSNYFEEQISGYYPDFINLQMNQEIWCASTSKWKLVETAEAKSAELVSYSAADKTMTTTSVTMETEKKGRGLSTNIDVFRDEKVLSSKQERETIYVRDKLECQKKRTREKKSGKRESKQTSQCKDEYEEFKTKKGGEWKGNNQSGSEKIEFKIKGNSDEKGSEDQPGEANEIQQVDKSKEEGSEKGKDDKEQQPGVQNRKKKKKKPGSKYDNGTVSEKDQDVSEEPEHGTREEEESTASEEGEMKKGKKGKPENNQRKRCNKVLKGNNYNYWGGGTRRNPSQKTLRIPDFVLRKVKERNFKKRKKTKLNGLTSEFDDFVFLGIQSKN